MVILLDSWAVAFKSIKFLFVEGVGLVHIDPHLSTNFITFFERLQWKVGRDRIPLLRSTEDRGDI
jgi:hypothetical protein